MKSLPAKPNDARRRPIKLTTNEAFQQLLEQLHADINERVTLGLRDETNKILMDVHFQPEPIVPTSSIEMRKNADGVWVQQRKPRDIPNV